MASVNFSLPDLDAYPTNAASSTDTETTAPAQNTEDNDDDEDEDLEDEDLDDDEEAESSSEEEEDEDDNKAAAAADPVPVAAPVPVPVPAVLAPAPQRDQVVQRPAAATTASGHRRGRPSIASQYQAQLSQPQVAIRHRKKHKVDYMETLSKGVIKRIGKRAGVKRMTGKGVEKWREYMKIYIEQIIYRSLHLVLYKGTKTMTYPDLQYSLRLYHGKGGSGRCVFYS